MIKYILLFSWNCLDCSLQFPEGKGFELHDSDPANFGPNRSSQETVLRSPTPTMLHTAPAVKPGLRFIFKRAWAPGLRPTIVSSYLHCTVQAMLQTRNFRRKPASIKLGFLKELKMENKEMVGKCFTFSNTEEFHRVTCFWNKYTPMRKEFHHFGKECGFFSVS